MAENVHNYPVILDRNTIDPKWKSKVIKILEHMWPSLVILTSSSIYETIHFYQLKHIFKFIYPNPTETYLSAVILVCYSVVLTFYDYNNLNKTANKLHETITNLYKSGFPLIRTGIIHTMKKNAINFPDMEYYWYQQKKCDEHIVTPLEYCNNLISGKYQPPEFKPNEDYINLLFMPEQQVIAITGAPVAMWIDPSLAFYLVNGCLASLIGHVNQQLNTIHSVGVGIKINCCKLVAVQNRTPQLSDDYKHQNRLLLKTLADGAVFSECGGFAARFFIISKMDQDRSVTLLDSLYALHELFGVRAYFVKEEMLLKKLEEAERLNEYRDKTNELWKRIYNKYSIVDSLPTDPEFLIFPQKSAGGTTARVFSYHEARPLDVSSADSLELVKIIASICDQIPDDIDEFWYKPRTSNANNCFVNVME